MTTLNPGELLRTAAFSALTGMRSMSPPALLSLFLSGTSDPPVNAIDRQLRQPATRRILVTMAAGELVADKFPQAPLRTFAPALVGRMATGAAVGAVVAERAQQPGALGAGIGAAASVAATYATLRLRLWLGHVLPVPGAISWAGLLEDSVLWLGGWWLLQNQEQTRSR